MNSLDLLTIISQGETSKVQFKLRLDNKESIADEMIAMSNSLGGMILFGVEDKTGEIIGLDYDQLQMTSRELGNIANDSVKPQIYIYTEVVAVGEP
ncbi:MAG: ATP-binding protein, partial [Treponema sp.]|nr:ATP-binding protein [Treponema sp.]